VARKLFIHDRIIKSRHIIARKQTESVFRTSTVPNLTTLPFKNLEELRKLAIAKVKWSGILLTELGLVLSDGQSFNAGIKDMNESKTFEISKKITKVECLLDTDERVFLGIFFYHGKERLISLRFGFFPGTGYSEKREVFDIAENEQLIGCELNHRLTNFFGVTWIKMKLF
jgi:hypothetical protein